MLFKSATLLFALFFSIFGSSWLPAKTTSEETAVVRAVLFYSRTCGHCHQVITEALPPLQEKYGDQLHIAGVDVGSEGGSQLFSAAIQRFNIPEEMRAVPMLIVGETVLLGSQEIPEKFPGLIEQHLEQGGCDWPDIPALREQLAAAQAKATAAPPTVQPAAPATAAGEAILATELPGNPQTEEMEPSARQAGAVSDLDPAAGGSGVLERLGRDPLGNALAILVLIGMLTSVVAVIIQWRKPLALQADEAPSVWIPLLCIAGMLAAAYLAYVETTHTQAVCGPVGDCNTVQQSEYARLFGVLPIGVLGLAGYAAILAAWLTAKFGPRRYTRAALAALFGMTLFGVLFSIYLTFLEPFVIGATCAWCLTSAVIMTALLWVTLPASKAALKEGRSRRRTAYAARG